MLYTKINQKFNININIKTKTITLLEESKAQMIKVKAQNCEKINCSLSHTVCDTLLWEPQQTNKACF